MFFAFFVKSPKTTKVPTYIFEISELVRFHVFPAQNYPQNARKKPANARKTPQTPANQKKTLFGLRGRAKLLEFT